MSLPEEGRIAAAGGFLGLTAGLGLGIVIFATEYWNLGVYMIFLAFFHWSEYMITAMYNHDRLSFDSFLLNHSFEYHVAAVVAWAEFALEWYFAAEYKQAGFFSFIGLVLVSGGELARKVAMLQAKHNFSHIVQHTKAEKHVLVTDGIYRIARHPSYMGWFMFSVGTQFLLQNPVCLIAYTVASWKFFNDRIPNEEKALLHFFGKEYAAYQRRVGSGVPFVKGYLLSDEDLKLMQ